MQFFRLLKQNHIGAYRFWRGILFSVIFILVFFYVGDPKNRNIQTMIDLFPTTILCGFLFSFYMRPLIAVAMEASYHPIGKVITTIIGFVISVMIFGTFVQFLRDHTNDLIGMTVLCVPMLYHIIPTVTTLVSVIAGKEGMKSA